LVTYDGLSKFIREPVFKELVKIIWAKALKPGCSI
jgi:hypothetical protein